MKKVAFFTTIFPMEDKYLEDFFTSINKQTFKKFDLILVNDGYEKLSMFKNKFPKINIIELNGGNNIAKNREIGINYAVKNKYDILIFGDSDDYFDENRIEISVDLLKNYDIVVNDLTLFNESSILEKSYISNRLNDLEEIKYDFIKDKNIFGLSNTAISLLNMKDIVIPESLNVVDWYFFSCLLIQNKKAVFTNQTLTYYRQYDNNLIGLKKLNESSYQKSINVKNLHYNYLLEITKDETFIKSELNRISNLKYNISNIKKIKYPLWWELV